MIMSRCLHGSHTAALEAVTVREAAVVVSLVSSATRAVSTAAEDVQLFIYESIVL